MDGGVTQEGGAVRAQDNKDDDEGEGAGEAEVEELDALVARVGRLALASPELERESERESESGPPHVVDFVVRAASERFPGQRELRILLLGEANFGFAASLVRRLRESPSFKEIGMSFVVVATEIRSEGALFDAYTKTAVRANLGELQRHAEGGDLAPPSSNVKVLSTPRFGVDATTASFPDGEKFHVVGFNFPQTTSEDRTGRGDTAPDKKLVRNFFGNARNLLCAGGVVFMGAQGMSRKGIRNHYNMSLSPFSACREANFEPVATVAYDGSFYQHVATKKHAKAAVEDNPAVFWVCTDDESESGEKDQFPVLRWDARDAHEMTHEDLDLPTRLVKEELKRLYDETMFLRLTRSEAVQRALAEDDDDGFFRVMKLVLSRTLHQGAKERKVVIDGTEAVQGDDGTWLAQAVRRMNDIHHARGGRGSFIIKGP